MTPAQFLARIRKRQFAPAYLFLGSDSYQLLRCREALLETFLEDRENGLTRHDLQQASLVEVIDDARALSLFAAERVIVAANAEAACDGAAEPLADYLKDPTPGAVVVFEAARFDFEGEERKKLEAVRAFYAPISEVVEMRRLSREGAVAETQALAKRGGVTLEPQAAELLVEALAADMMRIAVEMEKLSLYKKNILRGDVEALVPDARESTIFNLVNALARRDRAGALEFLDILCREGEYLPLALAFLSTQLRMATVVKEAAPGSARQGLSTGPARAEQIYQTASRFSKAQLEQALKLIFKADRDLRDARPDDRVVMERLVLELTA